MIPRRCARARADAAVAEGVAALQELLGEELTAQRAASLFRYTPAPCADKQCALLRWAPRRRAA